MGTTHSGTCLCGAVRFEISGSFERFYLCHCSRCRKGSGSAHAANLFFERGGDHLAFWGREYSELPGAGDAAPEELLPVLWLCSAEIGSRRSDGHRSGWVS